MKEQIPAGSRSERVKFARKWMLSRRANEPAVRFTRGKRRAIVIALYFLLLATVSSLADGAGSIPLSLLILLAAGQVVCLWLLTYSVQGLLMGDTLIDEREHALRDRATATAYQVLAASLGLVSTYVLVSFLFKIGLPIPSTASQLLWLMIIFTWLAMTLPQSVLAWTLPDPEE
jgi:hypothetical protein